MIKPLAPSDIGVGHFVVCDIENMPDGSVISIDTAWRCDQTQKIQHKLHFNWADWWDWLLTVANDDKRFRRIYAHNGGGWDWLSLAHYLLREGRKKRQVVSASLAASKMITMSVQITKQFTIDLCDSLPLLRSKLHDLGLKLVGRGKIDTGGLLPHQLPLDKCLEYQRGDTELLLEVLERTLELIREHVAPVAKLDMTIGATAMKVFRTIGGFQPISIPLDPELKAFLRAGYAGGRVEVFKYGYFPTVNVYDVNSLYPSVMVSSKVPTSDYTLRTIDYSPGDVGCYAIKYCQRRRDIPAVLTWGGKGQYEGTGNYFTPEIDLLLEVDPAAEITFIDGHVFIDKAYIFQDYVNRLYALRLSDPDGPISLICKFLLNSLYGKFGQKPERTGIICFDSLDDVTKFIPETGASDLTPLFEEDYGIYELKTERQAGFEHLGIAGMITSGARATLFRGLLAAGTDNVIYCDTDSVHTKGQLPPEMVHTNALGKFKREFTGEGVYAAKKLYGLRAAESEGKKGKEKIRAKGVSVGGDNGFNLSFDGLCRIAGGEKIIAEFKQPGTAKQTFKMGQPCTFKSRTRTLRKV